MIEPPHAHDGCPHGLCKTCLGIDEATCADCDQTVADEWKKKVIAWMQFMRDYVPLTREEGAELDGLIGKRED